MEVRYKCKLAYLGNNYAGFQSQANALAIQDVIEKALLIIFKKKIRIIAASRTDQGVHALGQVFHFDGEEMDINKLKYSLNSLTPKDIHIKNIDIVSTDFHARFSVKEKTYVYLINTGEYDVFYEGRAFQKRYKLDYQLMKEVANLYLGTHDFSSFNTTPYAIKENQVRTIYEFSIKKKGDRYLIKVRGDGFLKNMVRIMVGTMVEVARGKKDIEEVEMMFKQPSKEKRRYNIDANGLYLVRIDY